MNTAIKIAKEKGLNRRIALSHKMRSLIYKNLKQYDQALEDYRIYSKMFDTIFNIAKANEINTLELTHEFRQEKLKDSLQFAKEKQAITLRAEAESWKKEIILSDTRLL